LWRRRSAPLRDVDLEPVRSTIHGEATRHTGQIYAEAGQPAEARDWIKSQVPLKRFAEPAEIAEAVLYLCSSASSFVVGAEIVIDGGMPCRFTSTNSRSSQTKPISG
jgi:NAD(P)-dependent dehydrogenase (short-subunit alcohol dehydrogenase family)